MRGVHLWEMGLLRMAFWRWNMCLLRGQPWRTPGHRTRESLRSPMWWCRYLTYVGKKGTWSIYFTYVPFYDFLIPIASFITDFRYVPYHACSGRRITSMETAQKAFEACHKYGRCNCITDPVCDHDDFILYTGSADREDVSCSWIKVEGSPIRKVE